MHLTFDSDLVIHTTTGLQFTTNAIDDKIFYSVPTSFHTIDSRIPRVLREVLAEAQQSQKSNLLTGASACARKVVYELARIEKATGDSYEDRIKSLKEKLTRVPPEYFDTLAAIQKITSEKVHEDSYDGWESSHLTLILATLSEILEEIYVKPAVQEESRQSILDLKEKLLGGQKET